MFQVSGSYFIYLDKVSGRGSSFTRMVILPFHYGSHYSNAAIVIGYLMRIGKGSLIVLLFILIPIITLKYFWGESLDNIKFLSLVNFLVKYLGMVSIHVC